MTQSRDGYQWTLKEGLKAGLPCIGVIQPNSNLEITSHIYDVLVIGAGYTGLTAARDSATSGLSTLLLEARDRIGGRTWSSNVGGYPFEMGGTWVHWFQPHVYREISRYGMKKELEHSPDYSRGCNIFRLVTPDGSKEMTHHEENAIFDSGLKKFVNVDGNFGKTIVPFPFDSHHNPEAIEYGKLSIADRIAQIKDDLTADERAAVEAFLLLCSGGTTDNSGFLDFLRWWAAGGHNYTTLMDTLITFKFRCGQSGFALRFFQEALDSKKLMYAFDSPVAQVDDYGDTVTVTCRDGKKFTAKRVICTVPLNVLNNVKFNPPLNAAKRDAANLGHVNQCVKVHAEIKDREMRSWGGVAYPHNKLIYGIGDGETPAGNTHCVFFGADANHIQPEENIEETIKALKTFAPMEIERVIFHNWSKDEFAKGAWAWYRPEFEAKYLDALRARQGSIIFANSDWAEGGWRSFIDGAIQSGTEAAFVVKNDLAGLRKAQEKLQGAY